jgi:hypothetical protein
VVGSADSSIALPCEASADAVSCGAADSVFVEPLRDTTSSASRTTAITTAVITRFEDELLLEDLTDEGTAAPGVLAGREVTEEL